MLLLVVEIEEGEVKWGGKAHLKYGPHEDCEGIKGKERNEG